MNFHASLNRQYRPRRGPDRALCSRCWGEASGWVHIHGPTEEPIPYWERYRISRCAAIVRHVASG